MEHTSVDICPICLHPIGTNRRCLNPSCGATLDKGDWALPAVYGTDGLLPPDAPDASWRLPEPPAIIRQEGRVDSPLPLSLKKEDGVHHIGSAMSCHVRIAGIAVECVVSLHFHRPTGKWWAFDWCSAPGMATLNGKRFRNHPLEDDDTLSIAGARLCFRSGVLHADHGSGAGVVLTVSGLVDGRLSRSEPPHPLLDHVSFAVAGGEFVGILGPSGCGKSTLIKALAGLSAPSEGEIRFNGVSRSEASSKIRALTGYLPQDVNVSLHDELTLTEEIRSYLTIHKSPDKEDRVRANDLLSDLGLVKLDKREKDYQKGQEMRVATTMRVGDLSGGQRRRAALLLALLRNPSILLLDEPAAGLDRATETALMQDLKDLANKGKSILCATHELANLTLFDRVLVMAEGGIAYDGPPDGMFRAFGIPDGAGADRPRLLYEALGKPAENEAVSSAIRSNQSRILPPQAKLVLPDSIRRASWLGVFLGYLGRFRDSFLSFLTQGDEPAPDRTLLAVSGTAWRWIRRWLLNPPFVLFVWQPLLIAFCISVALESRFTAGDDDRQRIFFGAAIAAFWLGMGGSVRSLVATRANRSLERLEGVRRSAYLAAVSFSTLAKGAAQGIVLAAFLVLLPRWIGCAVPLDTVPSTTFSLAACLVAVEWMGGFVGLVLSASATEAFAVAMVPNLAVFALFFSQPLMEFAEEPKDDDSREVRFARVLPAHYAHLAMWHKESYSNPAVSARRDKQALANLHGNAHAHAKNTRNWLILCFFLTLAAQTVHEKNWKG